MKKTSLVVMAAGIGSRYGGGIKQMEPLGPGGEIMMDYAVRDALEAGFDKVVFIIRKDLDEDFRSLIGDRIAAVTEVAYAYQELDDLPRGFSVPAGRTKPWGTGQALLAAKDVIREPFAVINADDYYGKSGYRMLHEVLTSEEENGAGAVMSRREQIAMAAFVLGNTLSDNGGVTRGILTLNDAGKLTGIRETKNIAKTAEGAAVLCDGKQIPVDTASLVSMNMWGLYPSFLDRLAEEFPEFLADAGGDPLTKEFLLPDIIDRMLASGGADVRVMRSDDVWFGVTYKEDRDKVREEFKKLTEAGVYRTPLF